MKKLIECRKALLKRDKLDTLPGVIGVILSLSSGLVSQYVLTIGPPPPEHRAANAMFTSIVMTVVWLLCSNCFRPNTRLRIRRVFLYGFLLTGSVSGLLYSRVFWDVTYLDGLGKRHAKGTVENDNWKKVTDPKFAKLFPEFAVDTKLTEREQIEKYWGHDPSYRWTSESIKANESWLRRYWYPAVIGLTGLVAVIVASRRKTQTDGLKPKKRVRPTRTKNS
jgi:hypothetical protein